MLDAINKPAGWKWWLGWVGVNALGSAFGIAIGHVSANYLGEFAGYTVFGVILSLSQWIILRRRLPWSQWWVVAGALGAPMGLYLANWGQAVIPLGWYYPILGFFLCGLVVGILQAIILQYRILKGILWVVVSALGWALGGLVSVILPLPFTSLLLITVYYALLGIITGMSSGLFLALSFKAVSTSQASNVPPAKRLLGGVGF